MKSFFDWFGQWLENTSLKQLLIVVLVLLIVLLTGLTWNIWTGMMSTLQVIFKPFIYGFAFAYLLRPAVVFFEKYKIQRGISVPLIIVVALFGISFLFASFLPKVLVDLAALAGNFGDGIESLYELYLGSIDVVPSPIIKSIVDQLVQMSDSMFQSIPNIPLLVGDSINTVISWMTTTIFSFVIGLYFVMDYERITRFVMEATHSKAPRLQASLVVINDAVRMYLSSLLVVMAITFAEYSLFYFLVGHKYALAMGLLCAIALLVPYVGGMAMNVLGFISGLGLGTTRVVLILLGLLILPNIDSYYITPLVYKKRNKTNPLWSLFAFFACATLFGFVGVLISTPLYFSIRAVLNLRKHDWSLEALENSV